MQQEIQLFLLQLLDDCRYSCQADTVRHKRKKVEPRAGIGEVMWFTALNSRAGSYLSSYVYCISFQVV